MLLWSSNCIILLLLVFFFSLSMLVNATGNLQYDKLARRLCVDAYHRTLRMVHQRLPAIKALAEDLLEQETVLRERIEELLEMETKEVPAEVEAAFDWKDLVPAEVPLFPCAIRLSVCAQGLGRGHSYIPDILFVVCNGQVMCMYAGHRHAMSGLRSAVILCI